MIAPWRDAGDRSDRYGYNNAIVLGALTRRGELFDPGCGISSGGRLSHRYSHSPCRNSTNRGDKFSYRHGWRRITTHLGIPVSPRSRIDNTGRSVIESFAHIVIGYVAAQDSHIFVTCISHGIRHETDRFSERALRWLKPNNPPRDIQSQRAQRDGLHNPGLRRNSTCVGVRSGRSKCCTTVRQLRAKDTSVLSAFR